MRVLQLYAGNLYGGIERGLTTLARLRRSDNPLGRHFGLCFDGKLAEDLRDAGADVHLLGQVRLSRPWTVWRARSNLRALLAQEKYDLVICHAYWPHTVFAPVVRRARLPLVFWAHDAPDGHQWVETLARWTRPDLVVANSRFTQSQLYRLFPGVRSDVLRYPLPSPNFASARSNRAKTRAALNASDEACVILMASRLEAWKGHELLIKALSRLKDLANWTCWIAGGPQRPKELEYQDGLARQIGEAQLTDRIQFLGHRDDIYDLMAAADIYCQPNKAPEPFGVVFIEALYAGLPIVATAMGGPLEIVTSDCGRMTPPGDDVSLASALRELIGSPAIRAALSASGPSRASNLCDPNRNVNRLESTLRTVVKSNNMREG